MVMVAYPSATPRSAGMSSSRSVMVIIMSGAAAPNPAYGQSTPASLTCGTLKASASGLLSRNT